MLNTAVALLLQALGVILFFNRFIAGIMLRLLKRRSFDEADYGYQPTVTVAVPMYNEGAAIRGTIESLLALDYPAGKLDIVVIDDVSLEGLTAAQTLAAAVFANQRRDLVRDVWVGGVRRVQNRRHAEEEASLQGFVAARRQLLAETR